MFITYGTYHFRPKRLAFRNDYCLSCGEARRSVQMRTFDVGHIFWIPLLPVGFWKRWICTACGHQPHISPKTRRSFKWAGLLVLLFLSAIFWAEPVTPDFVAGSWIFRIGASLGNPSFRASNSHAERSFYEGKASNHSPRDRDRMPILWNTIIDARFPILLPSLWRCQVLAAKGPATVSPSVGLLVGPWGLSTAANPDLPYAGPEQAAPAGTCRAAPSEVERQPARLFR